MPIAIDADHLDIGIPSHRSEEEWQHLIDQLPEQHHTIRLHPAIETGLQQALYTKVNPPPQVEKAHAPASMDPAEPKKRTLKTSAQNPFSMDSTLMGCWRTMKMRRDSRPTTPLTW